MTSMPSSSERPVGSAGPTPAKAKAPAAFIVLGYLVFWGWTAWFALWLGLGVGPFIVGELCVAVWVGMVPWPFGATALGLVAVPFVGAALGLHPRLRGDPGRLLSMFYGVQAPLMLVLALRLFAIQQLSASTGLALAVAGLGSATLMRLLWSGPRARTAPGQALIVVGTAAYLVAGLWVGAVVGLYGASLGAATLPVIPDVLWNLVRYPETLRYAPSVLLGLVMLCSTLAVMTTFPLALLGITARAAQLGVRAGAERFGLRTTLVLSVATVAAVLVGFAVSSVQPQARAFAIVDRATTDATRADALTHVDAVRDGLVAAALAPERMLDLDPAGKHIADLWAPLVGGTLAELPRFAYEALFFPFIYRGVDEGNAWETRRGTVPADVAGATTRYAAFFDAPIAIAERDALVAAARSTWSWEQAAAGLLDVGQQKVHLAEQDVVVEPHGDVAVVTVHDVYVNHTWNREEVWLSLSLPETAAITGLWLGTSADRAEAFAYVVAPRGAAQEVYQNEVRERRDPALIEQVGPRQYRLRAFPVEPRTGDAGDVFSITATGPELHLWLELAVTVDEDEDRGPVFRLPVATQVRNLYWDADSERVIDGASAELDGWLPPYVAAPGAARRAHDAVFDGYQVHAEPAPPTQLRRFRHLAVLIDGTYSMDAHRREVAAGLDRLRAAAGEVDVLCTVEQRLASCSGYDPDAALAWGSVALETRLAEAAPLIDRLDGIEALVVLTDAGSYELAAAAEAAGLPDVQLPPLWLVHFGQDPAAYPDWTLDRLQRSGGGVASDVRDVLVRMSDPAVVDGYQWTVRADPEAQASLMVSAPDPFRAIAARRLVAELDRARGAGALADLDAVHAVAVAAHVVTPYSSMIVLVDEAQRKALADAEAREDRFDREVVTGQDEAVAVTSAPEPSTVALLAVVGIGAGAGAWRKRRADAADVRLRGSRAGTGR